MKCEAARLSLGVYLLDAVDSDERTAVETHLEGCPLCTEELGELAGLPALLSLLTAEEVEAASGTASPEGYERLLARAETEPATRVPGARHRSRWVSPRVLATAAGVAVVLAGAGLAVSRSGSPAPVPHSYTATAGAVRMSVSLTSQVQGTAVDVVVSGVPSNEHCTLVAVARNGTRHTIGTWQATYTGQATTKAAMSLPRSQLSQLLLLGDNGSSLVTLRL